MIGWRFPILDGGNEQGFNNSGIETFNGAEMYDNLAREICQNSLDAKDDAIDGPVIVRFTTQEIKISQYKEMSELLKTVNKCKEYWSDRMDEKLRHFFASMESLESNDNICILRISDENTCGLEGAKAGKNEKSKWRALAHADGVSDKGDDSGGSYGIGKNAPFVCSQLRTVFYNTYAKDGIRAFQGSARLMTHLNDEGEETVGTGHFCNKATKGPIFGQDVCSIRDLFPRNLYGTDVIVIGFYKTANWQDAIERAIVKNFFNAIYEGKLVVQVDNREISANRLTEIIMKHATGDEEMNVILELFEARTLEDHQVIKTKLLEEDDVELYVRLSDKYNRKVAELRNTGMIIRIRGKNVPKAYSAVMIVRGKELNKVLKSMEPPRHDRWDPEIITDEKKKKQGKNLRTKLIAWVNKTIDELCKSDTAVEFDPDGISQFLPDELQDGNKKDNKSSNELEVKTKIQKVTIKKVVTTNEKSAGRNIEGKAEEGTVNNATSGGNDGTKTSGAGTGGGKDKVGVPNKGTKTINRPALLKQRVYQTADKKYRAIIMMEDDCTDVYLSVTAIGDDGTKEPLIISSYEKNGCVEIVNSTKAGPFRLKGNVLEQIELSLELKEKMLIKLDVQ